MKRIVSHGNFKNKLPCSMIKYNTHKDRKNRPENNSKILKEDL